MPPLIDPPPPEEANICSEPDPSLPVKAKTNESLTVNSPLSQTPSSKTSKEKTATAVPGGREYVLVGLATPKPYLPMYRDKTTGELASMIPLDQLDASPFSKFSKEMICSSM